MLTMMYSTIACPPTNCHFPRLVPQLVGGRAPDTGCELSTCLCSPGPPTWLCACGVASRTPLAEPTRGSCRTQGAKLVGGRVRPTNCRFSLVPSQLVGGRV